MQTSSPAERLKGPSVVQRAARKLAADPSEFFRFSAIGSGGTSERSTQTLVCHAEPIRPDRPRQDERGVFAILRKAVGLPTDFTQ